MGQKVENPRAGGRRHSDVGALFPRHDAEHPALWHRDLGHEPTHRASAGVFPPQDGAANLGQTTQASEVLGIKVPHVVGRYAGGRFGRDGDLNLQVP